MALVYPEMAYSVVRPSLRPGPEPGLVGAWDLGDPVESVVPDLSGNGYDGTVEGGAIAKAAPIGMAMQSDGVNDYVNCGVHNDFNNPGSAISIEALFKIPVYTFNPILISCREAGAWALQFASGTRIMQWICYIGGAYQTALGPYTVEIDKWHHAIATYDNQNMILTVDGIDGVPFAISGPIGASLQTLLIFGEPNGIPFSVLAQPIRADISFVKVFNRALSDEEKKEKYLAVREACFKTDWGVPVSTGNQGGTVNEFLHNTPFQMGDATTRYRIETAEVRHRLCKIVRNYVAGLLYLDTQFMQENPVEAAFGTWEISAYVPATSIGVYLPIAAAPVSRLAAAQNGYELVLDATTGVIYLNRITGGAVAATLFQSAAGVLDPDTWYRIKLSRRNDGVFTFRLDDEVVAAAAGANPTAADLTHATAPYQTFEHGKADSWRWSYGNLVGDQTLVKRVIAL